MKKRSQYGQWKTKRKCLGEGGNGIVYSAQNKNGDEAAIKILNRLKDNENADKIYKRFCDEIVVIKENCDIKGIIKILENHLPDNFINDEPWYVMPLCEPVKKFFEKSNDYGEVINCVLSIGKTVSELHKRGICHRDIKPENILLNIKSQSNSHNEYVLADFGLAAYPEKTRLTKTDERIGAKGTIAPEMLSYDKKLSDEKPADVYSLAKTLWILLTKKYKGFGGQYNRNSDINRLKKYPPFDKLEQKFKEDEDLYFHNMSGHNSQVYNIIGLERLLEDSTDDNPQNRPTIDEFVVRLESWFNSDFQENNRIQWDNMIKNLFPISIPKRTIWRNTKDILDVLNHIADTSYTGYIHLPCRYAHIDMVGVQEGFEEDTIAIITNTKKDSLYVMKPLALIFESFDLNLEWTYFLLETGNLEPIESVSKCGEELIEISPGKYVTRNEWDSSQESGHLLNTENRNPVSIFRYSSSKFLFVQKISTFNKNSDFFQKEVHHNDVTIDEFRDHIDKKRQEYVSKNRK